MYDMRFQHLRLAERASWANYTSVSVGFSSTERRPDSPDRLDSALVARQTEDVPVVSNHGNDAGDL